MNTTQPRVASEGDFIRLCSAILTDERLKYQTVTDAFRTGEIHDIIFGPNRAEVPWWLIENGLKASVQELYNKSFGSLHRNLTYEAVRGLDHGDNGPVGRDVMLLLLAIMIVTVVLRFYSRIFVLGQKVRADDWMILAGMLTGAVIPILTPVAVSHYGAGRHFYEITGLAYRKNFFLPDIASFFMALSLYFIRISFLYFYLILCSTWPLLHRVCLITGIFITLGTVALLPVFIIRMYCDMYVVRHGDFPFLNRSVGSSDVDYFSNVFLLACDLVVVIIPIFIIHHLRLPKSEKRKVGVVFSCGILATIAAILRILWVVAFIHTVDTTAVQLTTVIFVGLEITLAIICSSMPTIRALCLVWWRKLRERLLFRLFRSNCGLGKGSNATDSKTAGVVELSVVERMYNEDTSLENGTR